MSDFMKWLYTHYIKPEVDSLEKDEYETHFSLLDNDLRAYQKEIQEKTYEFVAIQSFLLGLRTGQGLPCQPR